MSTGEPESSRQGTVWRPVSFPSYPEVFRFIDNRLHRCECERHTRATCEPFLYTAYTPHIGTQMIRLRSCYNNKVMLSCSVCFAYQPCFCPRQKSLDHDSPEFQTNDGNEYESGCRTVWTVPWREDSVSPGTISQYSVHIFLKNVWATFLPVLP